VWRIETATQDQNCEAPKIENAQPGPEHQCIANDLAAKALRSLQQVPPFETPSFFAKLRDGRIKNWLA
jgi:hypothetical protein